MYLYGECDGLNERSVDEVVILALFGVFTQQVIQFTPKVYVYIGKIDNARHSSVAVMQEEMVKQMGRDR